MTRNQTRGNNYIFVVKVSTKNYSTELCVNWHVVRLRLISAYF